VAQEALDALEHCRANKLSTNLLHQCGYSTRATVKLAVAEEKRIVRELSAKASKDVVQNIDCKLVVADVMTKHAIEEYVKPVEPEPEKPVVEPKGEAKGEAKVEVTEPK
ncbi:MAG: hypothetical protein GY838_13440, partial [bacterium]|nr:hypothetical protein [bacterium]